MSTEHRSNTFRDVQDWLWRASGQKHRGDPNYHQCTDRAHSIGILDDRSGDGINLMIAIVHGVRLNGYKHVINI